MILKKTPPQEHRRKKGHRQQETVLRIAGDRGGLSER